jgi:hypothetical protein
VKAQVEVANPSQAEQEIRSLAAAQDAAGNLTSDGSHTYFYDAENRLIQVGGTLGNLYSYVKNNPVTFEDPDGHCTPGLDCLETDLKTAVDTTQ